MYLHQISSLQMKCHNPVFGRKWGWHSHSLKWGLGSPPGLPKLQSSIVGVKTLRLEVFFISLKSYQSVDVENGLAWAIWTFAVQVMGKRRVGSQMLVWLPTTKSWESTRPRCVQRERNTPLKKFQGELQVFFRPHPNRRSEQRVMTSQSPKSPNQDSFGIPPWESRDKKPFGCGCRGELQRILYGGRWWLPPSLGHDESCESRVARGLS
jgi:hypothetical protein